MASSVHACSVMSWNVHRLSTLNAINLVGHIGRRLGCGVVLLQEAGIWDKCEFENASGWRLCANAHGNRDVAILLHGVSASCAAWSAECYFGVAAFVLESAESLNGILYVTAHLPDRSQGGDEVFEDALSELSAMMRRVPGKYRAQAVIVGMDANAELMRTTECANRVGEKHTGNKFDGRTSLLLTFMVDWDLVAANTFGTDIMKINWKSIGASAQTETHRLYGNGRMRQIDFVLASRMYKMEAVVMDGLREEAGTDHWPVCSQSLPDHHAADGCHDVAGSSNMGRNAVALKGWRLKDGKARCIFNKTFRDNLGYSTGDGHN